MVKKIIFLVVVIGSCFILNSCFLKNPDALNYDNFDIMNYNGNKYYLYKGYKGYNSYEFWGEYKVVGSYTSYGTAEGDACILENDIDENIIFEEYFTYF